MTMHQRTTLRFHFRPHQLQAHQAEKRMQVNVWHRRAGKTFYTVGKMVIRAATCFRGDWRAYYVAPTFKQAKGVSWDYLKEFTRNLPGTEINESELRVDLANGSRIQLLGAEQADNLRGRYANELVLDETALIGSNSWEAVLSPMLADRKGRATFIGTPMGKQNLFYKLFHYAKHAGDPDWGHTELRWQDTGAVDQDEIDRQRRTLPEPVFLQEFEVSWSASLQGAFYAKQMQEVERSGRITAVAYDAALPVFCAVDLGWSDTMVCIFAQQHGNTFRIIKAVGYEQTAIPEMVKDWRTFGFPIDSVILPHDAKVSELGTGITRREVFSSLGCNVTLAPNQRIHEGIAQVRDFLPMAWFDAQECETLLEALNGYRSEYDDVRQVHRMNPVHSWESHWADALRYLVLGRPDTMHQHSSRPRPRGGSIV